MNEQEEKTEYITYAFYHLFICKINHARSIALYAFYSFGIWHASNKHRINYGVPSYIRDPMNDIKLCTHSTHFRMTAHRAHIFKFWGYKNLWTSYYSKLSFYQLWTKAHRLWLVEDFLKAMTANRFTYLVPNSLQVSSLLMLKTTLWDKDYYYPLCTNE